MKIDGKKQFITGIIDSDGFVDSLPVYLNNITSHEYLFPHNIFKRWTWWENSGVNVSPMSDDFDIEDFDKVYNHLKRKYNIIVRD